MFTVNLKRIIAAAVLGIIIANLVTAIVLLPITHFFPAYLMVSNSMAHGEFTEKYHYQYLEKNHGYQREEIDSWPHKEGVSKDDLIFVTQEVDNLMVGDVVQYSHTLYPNLKIFHRIIALNGTEPVLKGDNNHEDSNLVFGPPVGIYGKVIYLVPSEIMHLYSFVSIIGFSILSWHLLGSKMKK